MRPTALARVVVPLAVALPVLALPASAATEAPISIKDFSYSDPGLKISTGDTVTWTNLDKAPHDATAKSGPEMFKSPLLAKGESWSHKFTKAGTYAYICSIHPQMTATLTVADAKPAAKKTTTKKAAAKKTAAKKAAKTPKKATAQKAPTKR